MSRYDASFEEGWGTPSGEPSPPAHADAVERGDVVPAARFRTSSPRPEEGAELRTPYLPWYEWRRKGPRGRALGTPAPVAPDDPAKS